MTPTDAMRAILAGLGGACVGSFVATAVLRQLKGEQALVGRSHCDGCARSLSFAETTPVLSYVLARGRCRCGSRIDPAHLVGELAGGALCAAIWSAPAADAGGTWVQALATLIGLALLALGLFDAKTFRLPDPLTAMVLILALAVALLQGRLVAALAWGAATFVAMEAVRRGYARLRGGEGLGFGDVKLLGALGVWLGAGVALALVLACALALGWLVLARALHRRLPFGPFLALGGAVVATLQLSAGASP